MSIYSNFKKHYKSAEDKTDVDIEIISKYKNVLPEGFIDIWKSHGFCSYYNGLFWTINPDEYTGQISDWFGRSFPYTVFARSAFGDLFILHDEYKGERTVLYLNVRYAYTSIISNSVTTLMDVLLPEPDYFMGKTKLKLFPKVLKKFGELKKDECYGYEPALALGGSDSIKNIKKVKIIPYLSILSQISESVE